MAGDNDKIEIHVWKGDWGLPSIDPNCLSVLAYCKFSGVPVDVKMTGNPWRSPTGQLPTLSHKDVKENKVHEIFNYLRKQNWGCDFELSTKESADVLAFSSMLEERLLPALLHLWWVDGKTYVDFTRPWFARMVPFPLNFFLPGRQQKAASLRVFLTKGGDNVNDADLETKIYKEAKECIDVLSYKLANNEYMFGRQPSSLDALVFGYLAPILKAPLPSNQLQAHLRQCDNLCALLNKILQRFFPPTRTELDKKGGKQEGSKAGQGSGGEGGVVSNPSADDAEFPNKRRNMILAAIFAATAMLGYASMSGLVNIRLLDNTNNANSNNNSRGGSTARPPNLSASGFDPLLEGRGGGDSGEGGEGDDSHEQ